MAASRDMATKKTTTKTGKAAPPPQARRGKTEAAGIASGPGSGQKAPSFSLLDDQGEKVTSASLKGRPYVLYFYPKDNTPGCTQEAIDFRDATSSFKKLGVEIFGVSPDSAKSHQNFREKYELPFRLLVDAEHELAEAYGVYALKKNYGREYMGIIRSTFLVGPDGKILEAYRGVKVKGHVACVLEKAKEK